MFRGTFESMFYVSIIHSFMVKFEARNVFFSYADLSMSSYVPYLWCLWLSVAMKIVDAAFRNVHHLCTVSSACISFEQSLIVFFSPLQFYVLFCTTTLTCIYVFVCPKCIECTCRLQYTKISIIICLYVYVYVLSLTWCPHNPIMLYITKFLYITIYESDICYWGCHCLK